MSAASTPRWPLPGELRMPLQIGRSALVEATFMAAAAINALALALAHVPEGDEVSVIVAAAALVLTGLWGAVAWSSMIGSRASDLVLGPGGLRIEGGPRHGRAFAWAELDAAGCRVENDRVKDPVGAPLRGQQLVLRTVDGRDVLVAEVWQSDDLEALYVALDELRAVHGLPPRPDDPRTPPRRAAPAAPDAGPAADAELLRCDGCGASAVPSDMSEVPCPMCRRPIAVPAAVRRGLADGAALAEERARGLELVRSLLEQPGATATNRRLALAAAWMFALPALGGLAMLERCAQGGGGAGVSVAAWVVCAALCVAVYLLTTPALNRRVSLRACLVELGARHDAGPRCRGCGAALADVAADQVVARCPYCRCENVLGVDLRPWRRAEAGRHGSLRQLLDERRSRLGGMWSDIAVCLGIAAIAATALFAAG